MKEKTTEKKKSLIKQQLLNILLENPLKSKREIANNLNSNRNKIWRKWREMEKEHIIWGYTAVVDESKQNKHIFLILMKTKPMMTRMADILIGRIKKNEPRESNIRLIDLFQVNGEYDWILRFSAPNHTIARNYYDSLRAIYSDFLLEKPVIVDINFVLVAEGKMNPEIDKLYDLTISPHYQLSDVKY